VQFIKKGGARGAGQRGKTMKYRLIFLGVAVFLCGFVFNCHLAGQTNEPNDFSKGVDGLFKEKITPKSPGAAVVVTVKGKPIFKNCYGLADVEHNVPVTPTTMFNLASVAKQFTAFAILLLEKEGKVSLEDDIHKYLPDLPDYAKPVTIRNLLNHTSGIWEYYSTLVYYCGYDQDDHFTLAEDMELLKKQKKLLFEPGSQWSYCNANYLLLAQVVEKITGATFQEWTKCHILEPLGMKDSFFMKNSSQIITGKAEPYKKVKDELIKDSGPWVNAVGMGYLFTNIEDMILWMDNFRTAKVGGEDIIAKMFQKTKLNDGSESFYGYGLGILTKSGKQVVSHTGQTAGYKTAMLYCPELELGITVLANERSINSEGLVNRIFDLYLGKELAAEAASSSKQEFLPFDPESAARFAGGYIVEGLKAKLAVNIGEDYLHCAFWGMGEDFFYPLSEKKFSNRSGVNFIEFSQGANGVPDKVTVTIRKDKMTANRILLDTKDLESRLPDYLGSYYSDTFSIVYTFRAEDGRLVMHHRRYGDMRLEPIDADEFFFIQGFIKFNRNQNGDITGFTLTPSDENFHFQGIDFTKVKSAE
jgi:CubicO group peptidase (beta-lactamase class C family)